IGHYTLVPNPFWGGALFPTVVFGFLFAFPWLERRFTGDHAFHNLLDRPRDAPWRTAIGAAVFTWVALIFLAGSADRVFVTFFVSYGWQIWFYRVAIWVVPAVVLVLTRRVFVALLLEEELERRFVVAGLESLQQLRTLARRAQLVEERRHRRRRLRAHELPHDAAVAKSLDRGDAADAVLVRQGRVRFDVDL